MDILIFGCGYVGLRVAKLASDAGHRVHAVTRSAARATEFEQTGLHPIVADVTSPATLVSLPACDALLYAVAPDRTIVADKHAVLVEGFRNVLVSPAGHAGRVLLVSSVSVYGQSDGEWVNETSPAEPQTDGGRTCIAAEMTAHDICERIASRLTILRMAGLYGPDRILARAEALRAGTPLAGRGDAWLNLIHADDAAAALLTAAEHPAPAPLYVVTDNRPIQRQDYYAHLSRLLHAPLPVFDESQSPRHGHGLNKRCSNTLLLSDLNLNLRYPTFVEGLTQAIASSPS